MTSATPIARHSVFEDALAILIGALCVSFGILLFKQGGLLSGGTAGIAFLIHYTTSWRFGTVFFLINLPFYVLAIRCMIDDMTALLQSARQVGSRLPVVFDDENPHPLAPVVVPVN